MEAPEPDRNHWLPQAMACLAASRKPGSVRASQQDGGGTNIGHDGPERTPQVGALADCARVDARRTASSLNCALPGAANYDAERAVARKRPRTAPGRLLASSQRCSRVNRIPQQPQELGMCVPLNGKASELVRRCCITHSRATATAQASSNAPR